MHEDAGKLIPELALWNNGAGIDLESWLGCIGRYDHATMYASLFWPDFLLHDDCILLRLPEPANYHEWVTGCGGDRTGVERVMNHRHLTDLFYNSEFPPTREIIVHLARVLQDMWTCKLRRDFPDRQTRVEVYGTDSPDLLDCVITVFQERR